ncbi:endonuclease III [candidate division WWE3 bacterium CG_4_9_14_3_um_filter_34_6]|uniref:Endonuclease III n=1 Tax=candidate division WWE3 bacterium CG_4_9_14_3_um_filter_34_6 TaxID=1975079 RepID=A0A2M7X4S4_UNCKA|nr:MAG: endonuclease III [candidate division WWE3 bacterium CG_4_9_14_3_um_filter_34_6]
MPSDLKKILSILHTEYKNPKTELENWTNTTQFMVCVVLSAQATDKGVNKVTKSLFYKYKTLKDFANANLEDVEKLVSSINYYKTKSKRIIDACKFILSEFNGKFPTDIEKLIKIPGIGRKSANVIINEALNVQNQGIVVDTHVMRVTNRLKLQPYNNQKDAEKIESELKNIIPKNEWQFISNPFVLHGRYICKAKNPNCKNCKLNKICPSAFKI